MPYFVRVKDPSTGHQFDVPEKDPRIGKSLTALNSDRFPRARNPRPPKHHIPQIPARPAPVAPQESSDTSPASESPVEAPAEATERPESVPTRVKSRK